MENILIKPGLSIRDDLVQERLLEFTLSKRHFTILRAITKEGLQTVYDIFTYVKHELHVPYESSLLAQDVQDLASLGVLELVDGSSKVPSRQKRRRKHGR